MDQISSLAFDLSPGGDATPASLKTEIEKCRFFFKREISIFYVGLQNV